MTIPDDANAERYYQAYLTTDMAGGPRTPISGERIVICLGRDEHGRPLELSIPLKESTEPGLITLYSINEPTFDEQRLRFVPETIARTIATNVLQIALRYKSIDQLLTESSALPRDPPEEPICSFCGKKHPETGPLVEGAGPEGAGDIFICRTCTETCLDMLEQERS